MPLRLPAPQTGRSDRTTPAGCGSPGPGDRPVQARPRTRRWRRAAASTVPAVAAPTHPVDLDQRADGEAGGTDAGPAGQSVGKPLQVGGVEGLVVIPVE